MKNRQQPQTSQQQTIPNKPVHRPSLEKSASNSQERIDGVYGNMSIVHAMTSLVGTVVQLATKEGVTWEGVLISFSSQCDIGLNAATIIDVDSPSEGNNIGHLISSLTAKQPLHSKLIIKMEEVVSVTVSNTDMDYASKGNFATDSELSKGKRNESDEKHLVPWTDDDATHDSGRLDSTASGSNGWTAEEMFARNEKLGVKSGFSDLDGTYTIALEKHEDTPEARERNRKAEQLAKDIEDNLNSRRRIEKENNDERDEEDQYSAVVRGPQQGSDNTSFVRPHQKHVPNRSNSGDDMNWRSHGNRPQHMAQKQTAFLNKGFNNSPRDQGNQRQDPRSQQSLHPRQGMNPNQMDQERRGDSLPKRQQPLLQQQHPQQIQSQQQQQHPPPHRPPVNVQQQQSQHQPPVTVKEESTVKSIAPSMNSVTNYARAVIAQPEDRPHNAWGQPNPQQNRDNRRRDEPISAPETQQNKLPSPELEIKAATTQQSVKVKNSPERLPPKNIDNRSQPQQQEEKKTEGDASSKKSPEREGSTSSVESIAKTSKLNPNAKEFTLNPTAKPFTPRSPTVNPATSPAIVPFSPQQQQQQPPVVQTPTAAAMTVPVMHVSQQQPQHPPPHQQMHHHHQPHHHPQPPMMQMQPHQPGMNRMSHPVILPQMVAPGNFIINNNPYHVVMNPQQYQQPPPPVNQGHNPRPGGHNKYKGNNNPNHNRNDQFNQNNVAAATGHPVLATAPIQYQQQPGLNGTQIFHPMYQMHGFAPRMPHLAMGQVYDPNIYSELHFWLILNPLL